MNPLKRLAGQTAIYGLSNILGRLLNFLLVPLLTRVFEPSKFGIFTEMYAYVSFLIIILTYGMETAYFRYVQAEDNKDKVFSTSFISIFLSSSLFIIALSLFAIPISSAIGYPERPNYVIWFALIIGLDAITAIPFAKLRAEKKAEKFALFRLLNIIVFIGLNLFFLIYCPFILKNGKGQVLSFVQSVYNPNTGVGYVFISNLISSAFTLILFIPTIFSVEFNFDKPLLKKMLRYALPLLVAGLAGMTNETLDRILIKYLLPKDISMHELGIYGACYKVSILLSIFIQAFRFAAEPFFFDQIKNKDSKKIYSDVMKYFVIGSLIILLAIMLYIDIVKYFIGEEYWEGLKVVPILLYANLFLGIFFNLSIWYKLTNKTRFGALLTGTGAIITIGFNFYLIPRIGYMGAAWTTLISYLTITIFSYLLGQRYFPIRYSIKKIAFYILLSLVLILLSSLINIDNETLRIAFNTPLMLFFLITIFVLERPKKIVI